MRTLREIMDEVYRLFDRRCRTQTALAKLSKLRARVRRFKKIGKTLQKLFSPNLEKALTFLDDSILPSTSNAVERGNRRHRKMQKSIYGVRTHQTLVGRMALDHIRDWYTVEIECVNVAGDYAYFAGEVKTASRSNWVGNWVSWAVYDGGEPGDDVDGAWGIFTNKTTAISNCENEVLPGPKFTVDTGNLQVHD